MTKSKFLRTGKALLSRYFVKAMGSMALGLFSSLIIGTILTQLFTVLKIADLEFAKAIIDITGARSPVVGAAIGVAIGYGLKSNPLALYAGAAAGAIGYSVSVAGVSAGPVGAFIAAVVGLELGTLLAGKTKLDILVVPAVTIISGSIAGVLVGPPIATFMAATGEFVNTMTLLKPLPMGIAVSSIMGLILTAPISSAALAIMMGLSGLAGGAATAGCCAHMVGFAVASYRENKMAGLLAQGLGTSMLQVPNIVRHPLTLLPAVITSIITGPLSTLVFKMENIPIGSGMGTSGLVGPIGSWIAMQGSMSNFELLTKIILLYVLIPAAIALGISEVMRKFEWIKPGHMTLDL